MDTVKINNVFVFQIMQVLIALYIVQMDMYMMEYVMKIIFVHNSQNLTHILKNVKKVKITKS